MNNYTVGGTGQFLIFRNGILLTDHGQIDDGLLIIKDGRIDYAGPDYPIKFPPEAEIIDSKGLFISPGFIDLHIHGGAGADFMDATFQDVETVMRFHALHGTTALCPTTATAPLIETLACLDAINRYRNNGCNFGRVLGAHIEGPFLNGTKSGCHLPQHLKLPTESEWKPLLEHGPIATMTLAPELPGARSLIEALHQQGAIASVGHSEALFHEIEEATHWGIRHATHLYCAMTDSMNNRWRGTPNPRSAGIVEAVYLLDGMSSELITDGKHLSKEMLQLALRNKGFDQLAIITDAMRGAGMPDGEYTFGPKHGMLAVVKNREARIPDGTALASSVFAMNEMVRTFQELTGCPLWQAVRMASLTPAEILGVQAELGSLTKGKLADVVLFDSALNVQQTYIGGVPVH